MTHLRKYLALLCVCVMVLSGCGKPGSELHTSDADSSATISTAESIAEESKAAESSSVEEPESTYVESSAEETPSVEETSSVEETTVTEPETESLLADEAFAPADEMVYAVSDVRLRQTPTTSTDSNIYGVLRAGQAAQRIGVHEEWSMLIINGMKLYVATAYLTTTAPETAPPETPAPQPAPETPTEPAAPPAPPAPPANTGSGRIVCIDAGHQQHGISEQEPNGPGSSTMKAKLTTGTQGCATGKAEYQLNLEVSMKVKEQLQSRGYQVVMIRESNDCPSSNAERALTANASGASIFIRIHANSSTDPAQNGCLTMAPTAANPYVSYLAGPSQSLSQSIVNHICANTGFRNIGVLGTDTMTGINWCTIPVTIVEMGYMSNPDEDVKMSDPNYQNLIAAGIADGVDEYFASH